MIEFKILKQSKKSRARLGMLQTPHGLVETPAFVPVATQATLKTLTSEQAAQTHSQLLICNTFHLHLKPGALIVKKHGGLHSFMHWKRPLMTDSGGFQVFSLGFGIDHGVGKIGVPHSSSSIVKGQQPKKIRITDTGVHFRSPFDGRSIFIGPKESIRIQEQLGADIIFAFDECTAPHADYAYTKHSLKKTHTWARICLDVKKSKQALYGIVQGGRFKDLRKESARYTGLLPFDGFGIGGEFGSKKSAMTMMIRWVLDELPSEKPRHLLGIGYLEDIPRIIKEGIDTFDCIVPTHFARHGYAFTSSGKLNLRQSTFLKDKKPLDAKCSCATCVNYSRGYIAHLLRAKEITPLTLLTFHNLHFFNTFVATVRNEIKRGKL
ncbi:MAG: tRNA guanosine(34) transglycosylase Tgt [Candidatus Harrisonbacteria bacterium CG10_big_fil_rev_8_21_14_0_10_42_17]|uniref:Queuine tRNA-ribosyltransferase n=1 Tax=Candidatus Harrisonbacteria bacterium CG10_big_fil_rev_8_21_14_0_10_42_17 TaxID=1974584 RepID=A0A2M6WJ65_9BACT|nr:MAG: tRNA guanosine(34) transglycosylase Tgt [Candidatus Harrisonbacteria bacterium CG10_big_fil_rev_8_21_14_0_10_42_17]